MSLVDEARQVRQRIVERMRELEPLVREYAELERLAAEMGIERDEGSPDPARASTRPARRPTRRGSGARSRTERAARDGELAERTLEAVRSDPGRTVGEYAEVLGVAPNALYRPVRQLADARMIVKRARQLFPE